MNLFDEEPEAIDATGEVWRTTEHTIMLQLGDTLVEMSIEQARALCEMVWETAETAEDALAIEALTEIARREKTQN